MTRILVPVDGSEQSTDALEYALGEFRSDDIVLLHVIDPIEAGYSVQATVPGYSEEWYEEAEAEAEELFEDARTLAAERGVEVDTAIEVGRPSRAIVEYADENAVNHVIMGSHGRNGVTRILLGSVAETVVRRSHVPVTVVR